MKKIFEFNRVRRYAFVILFVYLLLPFLAWVPSNAGTGTSYVDTQWFEVVGALFIPAVIIDLPPLGIIRGSLEAFFHSWYSLDHWLYQPVNYGVTLIEALLGLPYMVLAALLLSWPFNHFGEKKVSVIPHWLVIKYRPSKGFVIIILLLILLVVGVSLGILWQLEQW